MYTYFLRRQAGKQLSVLGICLGLIIAFASVMPAAARGRSQDAPPVESNAQNAPGGASAPAKLYLPLATKTQPPPNRIGYNVLDHDLSRYPTINQLNAGWYLNWSVIKYPLRPNGMAFVQTVRVHQELTCPLHSAYAWNRTICPYKQPLNYVVIPGWTAVADAVRANPGSWWLIGNEIDRRDWAVPNQSNPVSTSGQDEILPETYARAYHDLYELIKSIDPTAKVAIGGVIQATPQRLEYLTRVWNSYQSQYGTTMPVDVWNVHNFILPEHEDGRGAGTPPGISGDGIIYGYPQSHADMNLFDDQIRAFRGWMKARGQQDKPLIVSEYGILYPEWYVPEFNAAGVGDFMVATFDYFRTTRDCSLGMPSDGCRLVQRWAWYSLDDDGVWTQSDFNANGALFSRNTGQITATGIRYRDWVAAHLGELYFP